MALRQTLGLPALSAASIVADMRGLFRAGLAATRRFWAAQGREFCEAVLGPFLIQRSLLIVVVCFASLLIPHGLGFEALPGSALFGGWLRWDSQHYLLIAAQGYGVTPWGDPNGFFPLYPWLVRGLSWVLPLPVAALLVANVAALVALGLLYSLVSRMVGDELGRRSVWVLLLFPTSFFLTAGYSESTYLVCAIGAVLAWQAGRHGWATVAAVGAVMARPVGVFALTIPFVVGWLIRGRDRKQAPWLCLGALVGAGAILLTYQLALGDPLGFLHARTVQHLRVFSPFPGPDSYWDVLWNEGVGPNLMRRLLNWSAIALAGVAAVTLWRWREFELALLTVVSIAVPVYFHGGLFDAASMARYVLACFPMFIVLAKWLPRGNGARAYDLGAQMFQIALAIMFATWRWVE